MASSKCSVVLLGQEGHLADNTFGRRASVPRSQLTIAARLVALRGRKGNTRTEQISLARGWGG